MAGINAIALKFTDENYVTKRGLIKAMGTSLVDSLWSNIEKYRFANATALSLRSIGQVRFWYTTTDALKKKYDAFTNRIIELGEAYSRLFAFPEEKTKLDRAVKFRLLKFATEIEKKSISDVTLKAMLNGMYSSFEESQQAILGYRDLLSDCGEYPEQNLDEDYLVKMYSSLTGTKELVSFYRSTDSTSIYTTAVVGKTYDAAPSDELENLMPTFYNEMAAENDPPMVKALLGCFYLQYIKPLEEHNSLVASMFGKMALSPLAKEAAALIPLESVFLSPKFAEVCLDVQRTNDFTYFLLLCIEVLTPYIEGLLNDFTKAKHDAVDKEYKDLSEPEEKPAPKEEPKPVVPVEVKPAPVTPPVEVAPAPATPIKEIVEEEEAEYIVEEEPSTQEIEEITPEEMGRASFSAPKATLSDKEIREMAVYIRETRPSLNKKQALFYARNCTIGRYYTIQDYKRTMRVAYETARTSMDALAAVGLYKKLRIKNKFVYTPIKQVTD